MTDLKDRTIKDSEYCEEFNPAGVWILVEKDVLPEKTAGGIYTPKVAADDARKYSGTGVIRNIAPKVWKVFEQAHDRYWHCIYRKGDRIGFSIQTPITSPAPPQWKFESGDAASTKFIQIVLTDITGIFLHTKEQREEYMQRFEEANSEL